MPWSPGVAVARQKEQQEQEDRGAGSVVEQHTARAAHGTCRTRRQGTFAAMARVSPRAGFPPPSLPARPGPAASESVPPRASGSSARGWPHHGAHLAGGGGGAARAARLPRPPPDYGGKRLGGGVRSSAIPQSTRGTGPVGPLRRASRDSVVTVASHGRSRWRGAESRSASRTRAGVRYPA
jgi:hypothetical protein